MKSTKKGFSLIELLVVIAISAILAAILLSALALAKAKALNIQCASGVKQIMPGAALSAADSEDRLPYNIELKGSPNGLILGMDCRSSWVGSNPTCAELGFRIAPNLANAKSLVKQNPTAG